MLAFFNSAEKACAAVSAIFRAGLTPSAMEFMERDCIEYVMKHVDVKIPLKETTAAQLIVEVDGNDKDVLFKNVKAFLKFLHSMNVMKFFLQIQHSRKRTSGKRGVQPVKR